MQDTIENQKTTLELANNPRIIGHIKGEFNGPTLIFFGGIHGNEPAGVRALQNVMHQLKQKPKRYRGTCYGIKGNLPALNKGVRFIDEDLNRIWSTDNIESEGQINSSSSSEKKELLELFQIITGILRSNTPPFYFIDLHTTSGETEPFIVMNDSLLNRRFTQHYPLPVILGIEEYLSGALLSYINDLGYVSFGFESGQHRDVQAISVAENFVWYTLGLTGFMPMKKEALVDIKKQLNQSHTPKRFFEIYYQHLIGQNEKFKMLPGFVNFQQVTKGITIADYKNEPIVLDKDRQIFMPLYQKKGNEGFYFIRGVPRIFLWLSKYLRKLKIDVLLVALPGVRWLSGKKEGLLLNKKVARFYAKAIFHLFGYRARELGKDHLLLKNKERSSKHQEYYTSPWY